MQSTATLSPPLNDVQLMLLRLFSRPMSGQDLMDIKKMLLDYYDMLLQRELDVVMTEKQITREDFDRVLQEDQRTQ